MPNVPGQVGNPISQGSGSGVDRYAGRRELGEESRQSADPHGGLVSPRDNPIPYQTPWTGGPDAPSAVNSGPEQVRSTGGAVVSQDNRLMLCYGEVRVQGQPFRPPIFDGSGGEFYVAWGAGPIEEVTSIVEGTWPRTDFLGTFDNGGTPIPNLDRINPLALLPYTAGSVIHAPLDTTNPVGEVSGNIKGRWCYDPRENRFTDNADLSTDWFSDYAGPDVVTPGQADPWGGTDATLLHFPAGATNDYFRTYTVATVANQKRTVEVWVKAVGANVTGSLDCVNVLTGSEVESKSTVFVATTNRWRKLKATLTAALTGDAVSLRLTFPSAAVAPELLVFCPGLSLKGFSGGSTPTAGTEVVPTFAYTDNLALVALDVLCSCVDAGNLEGNLYPLAGNPLGSDAFTPRHVDVESFGEAARIAPPVSIVFSDKLSLDQAISRLRMAGRADIYNYRGRLRIDIDALHPEDPEIVFASNEVHDPAHPNNCRDLKISRLSAVDRPTRVTVSFFDKNANWTANKVTSEDPGVKDGTVPMREAEYTIDGVATVLQAMTAASWIRRVAKRSLRVSFNCSPVGVLLRRYQLIRIMASQTIVQSDGTSYLEEFDQEFLVTNFERMADGTFACSAREYNDDIYTVDDNADGDIVPDPQPGSTVPPVVRPISDDSFVVGVSPARDYEDITAYPTAAWAAADVNAFDGDKINDEVLTVDAGDFTDAADSTIRLDAGAAIAFGGARIALAVDSIPAGWLFEYSSDDSSWTAVTDLFKRPTDEATAGFWAEWEEFDTIPSDRYWRLRKGSSVAGTETIRELQFRAYRALYPYSAKVRVKKLDGTKLKDFDAAMVRQNLALAEFAVESITDAGAVRTLDVVLYNVNDKGVESIGVRVTHVVTAASIDTPQKPRMLRVDHATGIAAWQRGCYYKENHLYGGSYWSATNYSTFTASGIDDGSLSTTAWNPNAAGVSDLTLDITGEGKVFNACTVTFNGSQAIQGKIDQFKMQYYDGSWHDITAYLATIGTTVSYAVAGPQGVAQTRDSYVVSATSVRFEWDHRDIPGTPTKYRLLQLTSAAIDMPVTQVQLQEFDRWNVVSGFELWAGFLGLTDGASLLLNGKAPGYVAAGGPLDTEYSYTSALFDAGPYVGGALADRRRTNYPLTSGGPFYDDLEDPDPATPPPYGAPVGTGNTLGYLFEVTVKSVGLGPEFTESVARYGWDYGQTVQCASAL